MELIPDDNLHESGLYLPGAKEKNSQAHYGTVIEVARLDTEDSIEGDNVSDVPLNSRSSLRMKGSLSRGTTSFA